MTLYREIKLRGPHAGTLLSTLLITAKVNYEPGINSAPDKGLLQGVGPELCNALKVRMNVVEKEAES